MEILEQIFTLLGYSSDQKDQTYRDLDLLIKGKVVQDLMAKLPSERQIELTVENVGETLKELYSAETIEEYTRIRAQSVITEYVDFLLNVSNDSEKQKIAEIVHAHTSKNLAS